MTQQSQTLSEYVAETLVADPGLSYQVVADRVTRKFGDTFTRQGIARIAQQECPKLKRGWKKTNNQVKRYKCQHSGCRKTFKGERGYSGIHARFCKAHRSGKTS